MSVNKPKEDAGICFEEYSKYINWLCDKLLTNYFQNLPFCLVKFVAQYAAMDIVSHFESVISIGADYSIFTFVWDWNLMQNRRNYAHDFFGSKFVPPEHMLHATMFMFSTELKRMINLSKKKGFGNCRNINENIVQHSYRKNALLLLDESLLLGKNKSDNEDENKEVQEDSVTTMHLKLGDFFEPKAEKFLDQNAYESFTATVSEDEQKTYDLNTEAMAKGEHLLHQSSLQWIHMFEANYADMVFRRFASETEKQIFENREKRIELYWFDITPTLRERCLQYGNSKNIKKTMKPDQKQQISLFILKLKFYSQLSQFEQTLLLDFFLPNLKSGFKERTTGAGEFFPHHFVVAKNILQPALIIGHLSPNNHQGFQDALLALDGFPITFATIASIREFELRF